MYQMKEISYNTKERYVVQKSGASLPESMGMKKAAIPARDKRE